MQQEGHQLREQLLQYTARIVGEKATSAGAANYALERGWLDDKGFVTDSGRRVIEALTEQDGTRSVFRNF